MRAPSPENSLRAAFLPATRQGATRVCLFANFASLPGCYILGAVMGA